MQKKFYHIIICLLVVVACASLLVACSILAVPQTPSDNAVTPQKLSAPKVFISQDGVASWQEVPNATQYRYKIDGGNVVETTELSVVLENKQSIVVQAVGNGEQYLDSSWSLLQTYIQSGNRVQKLDTPCVQVDLLGVASWQAVENATAYVCYVDGVATTTQQTFIQLTDGQGLLVVAVGDGVAFLDSDASSVVTYHAGDCNHTYQDDGDCTTEVVCTSCGITLIPARQNHDGGTATCQTLASCDYCGTSYGQLGGHVAYQDDGDCTTDVLCLHCTTIVVEGYANHLFSDDKDTTCNNDNCNYVRQLQNPYKSMTSNEFYANYTKATSHQDALWRSEMGFMSGDISHQDQAPTMEPNRPTSDGKYIRNTNVIFTEDGNCYNVVDKDGNVVNKVYKGGGYVTLEEVAAYVFAFGDVPANYDTNKSNTKIVNSPKSSWGKYLRLNNSHFSGSTSRYPYEPALPRISGVNNGDFYYYEIDVGTTGTDCDPSYTPTIYNNGTKITRGAARIVYVRYIGGNYLGNEVKNLNDRYVFYTYNHYNDFQEYLNYQNGWGQIFGNITGGGTLSSKTDCNPTPYVPTIFLPIAKAN